MYATVTTPALKCRIENKNDQLFYLDKTGVFREVNIDLQLLSEDNNLVVTFQRNAKTVLTVSELDHTRFSVAFAIYSKGAWRLRARLLKTPDAGALVFPLHKTFPNVNGVYELPDGMSNTMLVLGIHSVEPETEVKFQAITDGRKYFGGFVYNRVLDSINHPVSISSIFY